MTLVESREAPVGHPAENATSDLARFAAGLTLQEVAAADQALLKDLLLDHAGVALGGVAFADNTASMVEGVRALGGKGEGTVIGLPDRFLPIHAALLNGALAHSLDFDDTNAAAALHPGVSVIPAAFAMIEAQGGTGQDLLTALAAGYETACRIGRALGAGGYARGFHNTSVAGIFGATAAAGRLAGVSAATLENAFGLAGSQAAGSMQYLANGAWNKRLHPGFAAHGALVALALARAGVRGSTEALEGKDGLLHSYSDRPRGFELQKGLGAVWRLRDTALKPYSSCRLTHSAIDAAAVLRQRFEPKDSGEVALTMRISPTAYKIVGAPSEGKLRPRNSVDAQFSVYFQAAVAWLTGTVALDAYEALDRPEVLALIARSHVESDPTLTGLECIMTAEANAKVEQVRIDQPLGELATPMPPEAVLAKFMSMAVPVLGAAQAEAFAARVARLEDETDVAALIGLLRPKADA